MRMLRFFIAHEWLTQLRSMRFRGLAVAYILTATASPVIMFAMSGRSTVLLGPGAYNAILLMAQPLLTSLFAAGLSIDAITRERDEGSFSVLSVAPISSAGYVFRRWLAVVAVCIPVTLLPPVITAAVAVRSVAALPLVSMFAGGWLLNVLPALLVSSALAIAIGTIAGRTVLAVVGGFLILSVGLEIINNLLYYAHLRFDGPGIVFGGSLFNASRIGWILRGYVHDFPSDAAYPFRSHLRYLPASAGTATAISAMCLAIATFYLKRTKRDMRPWKISETHQLRSMLRMLNRVREEFSPDTGATFAERGAIAGAIVLSIAIGAYLIHRTHTFEVLGNARLAVESNEASEATSIDIVAEAADIDATVGKGGDVRSRATLAIRNEGSAPVARLSFETNPLMAITRFAISSGRVTLRRMAQRVDATLDPPLAPHEVRRIAVDSAGMPGDVDFNLQWPGDFGARWHRYTDAPESIYLTDLSRSDIAPYATEVRMILRARDIIPILRYARWQLDRESRDEGFISESWMTPTAVHVRLNHRYAVVADSCGAIAHQMLESRCTTELPQYALFGGPLVERPLAAGVSLAYIPAHAPMAKVHGPTFASAVKLAADAWPSLVLPPHITFIELPREVGQSDWYFEGAPDYTVGRVGAAGSLIMVPEPIFTHTTPINPGIFAASIVSGTLRGKRRVVSTEAHFFARLFNSIAISRLGLRKVGPVEPGNGPPPDTVPILTSYNNSRLARVLAAMEHRVGAAAFVAGIDDFVNARSGPGTAKELIDDIGRRGGVDLSRMYADYFADRLLPQLTLVDVAFRRNGNRWDVTGAVKNDGTGEIFAPIALRTTQGTQWQTLRIDTAQRVPFSFSTDAEPRAVQVDPDHVTYRHAAIGTIDVVDYRGAS